MKIVSIIRSRRPLVLAVTLALGATNASAITISVNDNGDSAAPVGCTLRDAITAVNAGAFAGSDPCSGTSSGSFGSNDTITFDGALADSTITLQQGQLSVSAPLTIVGSNQTIDAAGASRIFSVTSSLSASNLALVNANTAALGEAAYVNGAGSQLTLDHTTISGASTSGNEYGAVGANNGASLTLTNSTVTANATTGVRVFNGATLLMSNTTVSDNTATCTGNYCAGGLEIWKSTAQIGGSTISGNTATGGTHSYTSGGAYIYDSTVSFVNCTIAENSASANEFVAGGASEDHQGSYSTAGLTLTNTTVSSNTASTTNAAANHVVGGVLDGSYVTGTLTLANTILAANTASGGTAPASDFALNNTPTLTFTYSLLGAALNVAPYSDAGNNNQFSDTPGLGPLENNGGHTLTMALLAGSLAIDTGSNALAVDAGSQPLQTDQTGFVRIYNGTVDMGAFEYPGDHIFGDGFE